MSIDKDSNTNDDTKGVAVESPAPMRWIFGGERPENLDSIDYDAIRAENRAFEEMFSCGRPKPGGVTIEVVQWDKNWFDAVQ